MKTEGQETRHRYETDALFNALPNFINENGILYHFHLIKGNNRISCWYKANDTDGGLYLGKTSRSGKTLNEALNKLMNWLVKFNYYPKVKNNILADIINTALKNEA